MPEIVGGGVALLDFDLDGDLDVYFAQGGNVSTAWQTPSTNTATNQLFRNDGKLHFVNVTEATGTGDNGYGMGMAVGDIDSDGDPDVYITNAGRNTMLRNDNGVFTDVTEESGTGHSGWGASALFFDADGDGDLDLYATNYLDWNPDTELTCYSPLGGEDYCSPRNYLSPALDVFYRNRGDGTFEDATVSAGFNTASGTSLGVVQGDWNRDGHPDLFVANDGMPDLLWMATGKGTWIESGVAMGCALDDEGKAKAGMGVDATDIDDDGDLDIIVCNLIGESDSLFRNDGEFFVDITDELAFGPRANTTPDSDSDGLTSTTMAGSISMKQAALLRGYLLGKASTPMRRKTCCFAAGRTFASRPCYLAGVHRTPFHSRAEPLRSETSMATAASMPWSSIEMPLLICTATLPRLRATGFG